MRLLRNPVHGVLVLAALASVVAPTAVLADERVRIDGAFNTQDFSLRDENGFGPFQGTLTFTGGTGSFKHASGALTFTAVATPVSVGGIAPTVDGNAYYLVRGTVSSLDRN
jgi:hypothetical protein